MWCAVLSKAAQLTIVIFSVRLVACELTRMDSPNGSISFALANTFIGFFQRQTLQKTYIHALFFFSDKISLVGTNVQRIYDLGPTNIHHFPPFVEMSTSPSERAIRPLTFSRLIIPRDRSVVAADHNENIVTSRIRLANLS
jgi:hypothetical protein